MRWTAWLPLHVMDTIMRHKTLLVIPISISYKSTGPFYYASSDSQGALTWFPHSCFVLFGFFGNLVWCYSRTVMVKCGTGDWGVNDCSTIHKCLKIMETYAHIFSLEKVRNTKSLTIFIWEPHTTIENLVIRGLIINKTLGGCKLERRRWVRKRVKCFPEVNTHQTLSLKE